MDFLLLFLCLFVVLAGLALFSNRARDRKDLPFELEANCLMTRWPILFLTGPRSFFYFAKYWNVYTSFLAEHGYEVFTLHLPWNRKPLRLERFKYFLKQQEANQRHFHLVLDSHSLKEFENVLKDLKPACVMSITEVANPGAPDILQGLTPFPLPFQRIETVQPSRPPHGLMAWSYDIHRLMIRSLEAPELSTLGAVDETALNNAKLLLPRMQQLGEMDLRE
ncbi:hypothetical protein D3C87_163020 [compost metagenome]